MSNDMNRRDFLKGAAATGAVFLAADILGGTGFADGTIRIPEVEKITVTIIIENYAETTRPSYKIGDRYSGYLYAQPGLASHIETVVDGRSHSLLFDFGPGFSGVSSNMDALNIQPENLEALALSHGHQDHVGGLLGLLNSRKEKTLKGIPFYVGDEAFAERGVGKGPDDVHVNHRPPKKEEIEALGFVKIVEIKDPTPICPGACLTGRIERVTDYERVDPRRWVRRGDHFAPENFIGEQSVVLNLKGKGLVVFTGCAHVGVVNTVRHAQKMSGVTKVHAIMGGFHLTGAKEEVIRRTVADIKAMTPDYIMPMHCTGFEALTLFAKEMPDQFILNTVGTRYTLSS